jgi:hypothetical protein
MVSGNGEARGRRKLNLTKFDELAPGFGWSPPDY